jgi:glutamyl-tRNA reductase
MDSETLQLFAVGINYKTSTISDREKFQINRKEISGALNYFQSKDEVEGIVIVSTCNRLEFYLVLKQNVNPFTVVNSFYFEKRRVEIKEKQNLFYSYSGAEVAKHLFKVITGLDSMLLGEYQVQGQIKEAYSIACSQKSADKILHKLFHAAFRVGKNVRSKTKIGSGKQSLSGVAFQIIKEKLKREDVVTIVGVNQNTKIIAELLFNAGFSHLIFVNRTLYKAEELAEKYNGLAFSLDRIQEPLISSKCVFTCTGSADYILTSGVINIAYNKSHCPCLLIDMAIPRDINTDRINKDIEIIDLEVLKKYLEVQKTDIEADMPLAQKIISDEANIFEVWNESQKDDYLGVFAEKIESIRLQFLDETKLQVSEEELHLLDKFSRSLLHRMKSTITQTVLLNNELQEK